MRKLIVSNFVTLDGYYETKQKTIDGFFRTSRSEDQTQSRWAAKRPVRLAHTRLISGLRRRNQ